MAANGVAKFETYAKELISDEELIKNIKTDFINL